MFDANSFINTPVGGANATRRDPLPPGETIGMITKVDIVDGEKNGRKWYKLNATIDLTDPSYLAQANRDKASITYGIMLDMTDAGTIAMGPNTNVRLGKLREATGTNEVGRSLGDMVGRPVRVQIAHRADDNDPAVVYDDVKGVARM